MTLLCHGSISPDLCPARRAVFVSPGPTRRSLLARLSLAYLRSVAAVLLSFVFVEAILLRRVLMLLRQWRRSKFQQSCRTRAHSPLGVASALMRQAARMSANLGYYY